MKTWIFALTVLFSAAFAQAQEFQLDLGTREKPVQVCGMGATTGVAMLDYKGKFNLFRDHATPGFRQYFTNPQLSYSNLMEFYCAWTWQEQEVGDVKAE